MSCAGSQLLATPRMVGPSSTYIAEGIDLAKVHPIILQESFFLCRCEIPFVRRGGKPFTTEPSPLEDVVEYRELLGGVRGGWQ